MGSQWQIFLDVAAARRFGAKKLGKLPLELVPIAKAGAKYDLVPGGTPARFSLEDAEHIAHMLGRYKLGFGDLVYTYVEKGENVAVRG